MKRPIFIFLALILTIIAVANAQQVLNPSPRAMACAYNLTPPTVTSGKFVYLQCNTAGNILVH